MASQELSVAAEHNLVVNEKFEGGGWVRVFRSVFLGNSAIEEHLWRLRPKEPQWIKLFGRWTQIPRRQLAMGRDYTFAGQTAAAEAWDHEVVKILEHVTRDFGVDVNGCLINFYDGAKDYIGSSPHVISTDEVVMFVECASEVVA